MYRCKQRGVDYDVFDDGMRARATKRLGLEEELRHALDEGQFDVHYQPLFELTTGSIASCEALLRWAIRAAASSFPATSWRSPRTPA